MWKFININYKRNKIGIQSTLKELLYLGWIWEFITIHCNKNKWIFFLIYLYIRDFLGFGRDIQLVLYSDF